MLIKENVTVYICEHCKKKKLFLKHAMFRHEQFCRHNPANMHACFDFCKHLVKETHEVEEFTEGGFVYTKHVTAFKCTKLDKYMYSSIAEKKNLIHKFPASFTDTTRMPLTCQFHEKDPVEFPDETITL